MAWLMLAGAAAATLQWTRHGHPRAQGGDRGPGTPPTPTGGRRRRRRLGSAQTGPSFGGSAGTVTGSALSVAAGLQFATTGYTVTGGTADPQRNAPIRRTPGDGHPGLDPGRTVGLTKEGDGTLVIGGAGTNSYSGTTNAQRGPVQINKVSAWGPHRRRQRRDDAVYRVRHGVRWRRTSRWPAGGGQCGREPSTSNSGTITLRTQRPAPWTSPTCWSCHARGPLFSGALTGSGTLNVSGLPRARRRRVPAAVRQQHLHRDINVKQRRTRPGHANVNALSRHPRHRNVNSGGSWTSACRGSR